MKLDGSLLVTSNSQSLKLAMQLSLFSHITSLLRGVCYIPQDKIGIVEKSGRQDLVLCRLSFGILACP
jgi:hypothetical protein